MERKLRSLSLKGRQFDGGSLARPFSLAVPTISRRTVTIGDSQRPDAI